MPPRKKAPPKPQIDETMKIRLAIAETVNKEITPEERLQIIQKTILKNFTPAEISLTVQRSHSIGANILAGDFWAYKDSKGNLINIVSRQFLGRKAEENPEFDGLQSGAVYEKDVFKMNQANGDTEHQVVGFGKIIRGKLLGAWAIAWRKNGKPVCTMAEIDTYDKKQYIWASHKEAMIVKVAENIVLRKFALLGADILGEGEYEPVDKLKKPTKLELSKLNNNQDSGPTQ